MDDLKRKMMELLGYQYPEQQTSPQWLAIEKLMNEAFQRGFNSGQQTERDRLLDSVRAKKFMS